MSIIKTSVSEDTKKLEHLCIAGGNVNGIVAVENSLEVLRKLEIKLPCDPRIPTQHISQQTENRNSNTCKPMFTAALFTMAKSDPSKD